MFLYNLLAFATQPLLGAVCDRFPRRPWAALGLPDGGGGGVAGVPLPGLGGGGPLRAGQRPVPPGRRPGRPGLLPRHLVGGRRVRLHGGAGGGPGHVLGHRLPPALDRRRPWRPCWVLCALFCWKTPLSPAREGSGDSRGFLPALLVGGGAGAGVGGAPGLCRGSGPPALEDRAVGPGRGGRGLFGQGRRGLSGGQD